MAMAQFVKAKRAENIPVLSGRLVCSNSVTASDRTYWERQKHGCEGKPLSPERRTTPWTESQGTQF